MTVAQRSIVGRVLRANRRMIRGQALRRARRLRLRRALAHGAGKHEADDKSQQNSDDCEKKILSRHDLSKLNLDTVSTVTR